MKPSASTSPADQLVRIMTRVYQSRLTTPSGGNLSVLDDDGGLWVTPSQIDKGRLTPAHMVRIGPDDAWRSDFKPTSEWPFHRAILGARPDFRAIVHAHPTSLVAFSVVGKPLPVRQFPDLGRWIGRVGFAPYAVPGSRRLGEVLAETFASGCDASLMENHGAVAGGRTLDEAFHRFEALEHLASILLAGARLDELRPRTDDELAPAIAGVPRRWATVPAPGGHHAKREELADFVRRAHGRGLLGSLAGTFSCRCGAGLLVTPDGADSAELTADALVYVEGDGCEPGKRPHAMVELHRAVYARHAHVHAIATALPPHLMAFAATGTPFDARTIPEAYMFLKSVPTLPYAARCDGALVAEALGTQTPMALVESACAVVTGATPFAVFDRLDIAEFTARSILDCAGIGRLRPMPDDALAEVCRAYGC